jgi:hypothetical protein
MTAIAEGTARLMGGCIGRWDDGERRRAALKAPNWVVSCEACSAYERVGQRPQSRNSCRPSVGNVHWRRRLQDELALSSFHSATAASDRVSSLESFPSQDDIF